jgi:adenylosuccinate synthase
MGEFVNPERFAERFREVLDVKNRLLKLLGGEPFSFEELHSEYAAYADQVRPYVADTDTIIQSAVYGAKRVLFEGAQGTFLDLDHGTYPYVTSSHPLAGGACLGTGVGPRAINNVIGVCKAYTTRVGSGPFPTEQDNETGDWIRQHGREFGTVTGRSRRCGWLDAVVLRQSARINSLSGWAVTRLDILSVFEEVQVGTRYLLDGEPIDYMPTDLDAFGRCCPEFTRLAGWKGAELKNCRRLEDLPASARAYLAFIEEQTGTPVAMVSVGPDRAETIMIRPDLVW